MGWLGSARQLFYATWCQIGSFRRLCLAGARTSKMAPLPCLAPGVAGGLLGVSLSVRPAELCDLSAANSPACASLHGCWILDLDLAEHPFCHSSVAKERQRAGPGQGEKKEIPPLNGEGADTYQDGRDLGGCLCRQSATRWLPKNRWGLKSDDLRLSPVSPQSC